MDQHKIKHIKKIGGEISSGGVPFSIDVKGGDCCQRSSKENKIIIHLKKNSSKIPYMKYFKPLHKRLQVGLDQM